MKLKEEVDNESKPVILAGLSDEQLEAMAAVEDGHDITLLGCPGCGKTKCFISQIVLAYPQKKILVISYNRALADTTKSVLSELATNRNPDEWVFVSTYHGTLGSIIQKPVENDIAFFDALEFLNLELLGSRWPFRDFSIVIFDEAQDMRQIYFDFACYLKYEVCSDPDRLQTILVGDDGQVLYDFYPINKADARFLTLAEQLFTQVDGPNKTWWHGKLTKSFRITPQNARFLAALMPSRAMVSAKTSRITDWVTLYIADVYLDAAQIVYNIVKSYCCGKKKRPFHQVVVLCASLNESSPAVAVVDLLVANGIPVHVDRSGTLSQTNGNDKSSNPNCGKAPTFCKNKVLLDPFNTTLNKVNFKTNCKFKGLGAKRVIMINASPLLHERHVTNQQFVTMTRAEKLLDIIQHAQYTCQSEVDELASKLTQRDLEIIVKRPLSAELRTRVKDKAAKNALYAKNNSIHTISMFSFLDIAHMRELLNHLQSTVVVDPCEALMMTEDNDHLLMMSSQEDATFNGLETKKTVVFDEHTTKLPSSSPTIITAPEFSKTLQTQSDDDDAKQSSPFSLSTGSYIREMTKSFDKENTYFNLVGICTSALQLALEFMVTRKTPVKVNQVLRKIGLQMDPKYCKMRDLIHDALAAIYTCVNTLEGTVRISVDEALDDVKIDTICDSIWTQIESFASLAIAIDASRGYRELLHSIPSFDFINSLHVYMRLKNVYRSFLVVLSSNGLTHMSDCDTILWHKDETGRFLHVRQPVQLMVCPAILCHKYNFSIHFSNSILVSHDDQMIAVANSLVTRSPQDVRQLENKEGDAAQNMLTSYVLNFVDASVQEISLVSDSVQPEINVDDNDKKGDDESSATNLKRRQPCTFLEHAISYKMTRCDEECEEIATEDQAAENVDAVFIREASHVLRKIGLKRQTRAEIQKDSKKRQLKPQRHDLLPSASDVDQEDDAEPSFSDAD